MEKLAGGPEAGRSDCPTSKGQGMGRQQHSIGSVYVGGYCGMSESELCIFGKLCPVGFIVVNVRRFCCSL